MTTFRQLNAIPAALAPDGAYIQEIAGRSVGLASHSLAVITHPAGTTSRDHHHTVADEVYLVQAGRGRLRLDGVVREIAAGDAIIIRPGQRHKLWSDGPGHLVLVVTCGPAYAVDEVIWDED